MAHDSVYRLYQTTKGWSGLGAFGYLASIASDPARSHTDRADALAGMGHIARGIETDLMFEPFEDDGATYYRLALEYDPTHVDAAMVLLSFYKQPPRGHHDHELAARCLKILQDARDTMGPWEKFYLSQALPGMRRYGGIEGLEWAENIPMPTSPP